MNSCPLETRQGQCNIPVRHGVQFVVSVSSGNVMHPGVGKANPNTNQLRGGTCSAEYQKTSN